MTAPVDPIDAGRAGMAIGVYVNPESGNIRGIIRGMIRGIQDPAVNPERRSGFPFGVSLNPESPNPGIRVPSAMPVRRVPLSARSLTHPGWVPGPLSGVLMRIPHVSGLTS